jgi:hypothetical protein
MPAIPAPTMQTSALIFFLCAGVDGFFDVADQGDTPSLEIEKLFDTDLTTRRRECACSIAFSPDMLLRHGTCLLFGLSATEPRPAILCQRN